VPRGNSLIMGRCFGNLFYALLVITTDVPVLVLEYTLKSSQPLMMVDVINERALLRC